jgi:isopenicillin-N epimerase
MVEKCRPVANPDDLFEILQASRSIARHGVVFARCRFKGAVRLLARRETNSVTTPTYGNVLRDRFLLQSDATYLNHGGFGATPIEVLAAQSEWRARMEAQPARFMSTELPPALAAAATELADFLGAEPADLAFIENATAGCNAVLRSLRLGPGDEVLINDHIYPAVRNVARHVCAQSGATLVEAILPFPVTEPGAVVAALAAKLSDRTRVAVIDLITSHTATILPVAEFALAARAAGARLLVDAAHAPGHIELDLSALGADWVTGNAHKWLFAPKGCAFLWADRAAQAGLHPTVISHGYGKGFKAEFAWTGTRDPSSWLAVTAAIGFYRRHGDRALRAHNHELARRAGEMLAEAFGSELSAPASMRGAMAAVALPIAGSADLDAAKLLHERLWQRHRIEVPINPFAGRLWLRISAQIYNEMAEYERLATALRAELG